MKSPNGTKSPTDRVSLVLGLGEVGKPLLEVLQHAHSVEGVDIDTREISAPVAFMHVCYPAEIDDFVGVTVRYVTAYEPEIVVIHSTVGVGTTREVGIQVPVPVIHSPVRGKHVRMVEEMRRYTKFIGSDDPSVGAQLAAHFEAAGMNTKLLESPEATELAKLTETTYFGLLIAFAQDVDRMATQLGVSYDQVVSFYEEIGYLPPDKFFPGVIGGHCVMPNIELLKQTVSSEILDAIQGSNRLRSQASERDEALTVRRETQKAEA